jgi:hypothetical protein
MMRGSLRLVKCLAAAGLAAALAGGCAAPTGSAGTGAAPTGSVESGAAVGSGSAAGPASNSGKIGGNVAAFDARAKLVAAAWDRAGLAREWLTGLVLMQPVDLIVPGDKDFATGDQKLAFLYGRFTLAGRLPAAPLTGKVRWPGGATATAALLTATQAYRTLATEQPCQGQPCPPSLTVTGATPGTLLIWTSRGKAVVPAWTFTVPSLPSPITVAALAPGSYHTQPDHLPGLPSGGLDGFNGAGLGLVSADGRQIHVLVGTSPCDTKSGALVYETATAVVVGAWTYDPHPDAPCAASLEVGAVPVTLARPLGHRAVLSVADGRPLAPGYL